MGRRLEAVPTRLQGRPWAGSFSVTWGEDGGRGLGTGQMLGVHDERTEQRGEKETQGRGASRHCSPSSEPWGCSIMVRTGPILSLPSQPHRPVFRSLTMP